jgi:hypothetical protein
VRASRAEIVAVCFRFMPTIVSLDGTILLAGASGVMVFAVLRLNSVPRCQHPQHRDKIIGYLTGIFMAAPVLKTAMCPPRSLGSASIQALF